MSFFLQFKCCLTIDTQCCSLDDASCRALLGKKATTGLFAKNINTEGFPPKLPPGAAEEAIRRARHCVIGLQDHMNQTLRVLSE